MQAAAFASLRVKRRSLADRPGRDVSQKEEFGAPEKKGIGATLEENGGDDETRTRDLCRDSPALSRRKAHLPLICFSSF